MNEKNQKVLELLSTITNTTEDEILEGMISYYIACLDDKEFRKLKKKLKVNGLEDVI
jgi:hypothetical protein